MLTLPLLAQANTLSFISSLFGKTASATSAESASFNSQTVPILAAAINLEPNPPVGGGDITVVDGSALVSQEGPSGTAADVSSRPAVSQISVYVVRSGDTLSEIAQMFGVSVNTIKWANNITGGIILPGQSLIILPITGIQHTVVKGETLTSLAAAYKSNAHDIAQYNDLADGAVLSAGQMVIIPDGEVSGATQTTSNPSSPAPHSTPRGAIAKVTRLANAGKPTAKLHGVSQLDEGNYYLWPVDGGAITQGLHGYDAVDIGAPKGTAIFAAAGGEVIVAKSGGWNGGYGSYVVIAHGNGTQTLYGHASKILVSAGDIVTAGQTIALVGATGEATGPHLHFEVRGAKNPFGDIPLGSGE